jgi:hypothetical protein
MAEPLPRNTMSRIQANKVAAPVASKSGASNALDTTVANANRALKGAKISAQVSTPTGPGGKTYVSVQLMNDKDVNAAAKLLGAPSQGWGASKSSVSFNNKSGIEVNIRSLSSSLVGGDEF